MTNRRLVFRPMRNPLLIVVIVEQSIDLDEIEAVAMASWFRSLWSKRPGVTPWHVELRDGSTYRFQTRRGKAWVEAISAALRQRAQR